MPIGEIFSVIKSCLCIFKVNALWHLPFYHMIYSVSYNPLFFCFLSMLGWHPCSSHRFICRNCLLWWWAFHAGILWQIYSWWSRRQWERKRETEKESWQKRGGHHLLFIFFLDYYTGTGNNTDLLKVLYKRPKCDC